MNANIKVGDIVRVSDGSWSYRMGPNRLEEHRGIDMFGRSYRVLCRDCLLSTPPTAPRHNNTIIQALDNQNEIVFINDRYLRPSKNFVGPDDLQKQYKEEENMIMVSDCGNEVNGIKAEIRVYYDHSTDACSVMKREERYKAHIKLLCAPGTLPKSVNQYYKCQLNELPERLVMIFDDLKQAQKKQEQNKEIECLERRIDSITADMTLLEKDRKQKEEKLTKLAREHLELKCKLMSIHYGTPRNYCPPGMNK